MKQIMKQIHHEFSIHKFDYLLFLTAGVFFLLALQIFKGERLLEFIILLAFCSFYIIWGMYHHVIDRTIHLKNIIEYVFIGFIIIFLVKLIIFP